MPSREPTFLPLTISASGTVSPDPHVHSAALRADTSAADCWTALLAGCDGPSRHQLPRRLRELADATLMHAGPAWGEGCSHRNRIGRARTRIEEAVADRDGAEFAEAFVGYDQAVATALVRAHNTVRSPAR